MSLLRVLHLAGILTRGTRHILRPIELPGLRASSIDARLRQCRRIRAHIRNMAVLVQTLGDAHRPLRGVVQFPAGLLLERRRHKRRIRAPRVRLLLDGPHRHRRSRQLAGQILGGFLIESHSLRRQLAIVVEVPSLCDALTIDFSQPSGEGTRFTRRISIGTRTKGKRARQIPIISGGKRDTIPLTFHNDAGSYRLHATSRQARHHFLPQHRRNLVPIQSV